MFEWIKAHAWWVGTVSVATLVGSLIVLPILVTRMPADYFLEKEPPPESWRGHHPVLRFLILGTKNLLGVVLVVAGLAMLVLPGQGILTILIGMTLVDFPGKRRLELFLVRQRPVLLAINWMRRKAHHEPLHLPAP